MDTAVVLSGGVATSQDRRRIVLMGAVTLTLAGMTVAVAVALAGARHNPGFVAVVRALMIGVPAGVGLYAVHQRWDDRFGWLLVLGGVGFVLTSFAESRAAVPYTIGRIAAWVAEGFFVYLILSFPSGRLSGRADRLVTGAVVLTIVALYLPRLVIADGFQVPNPYTSCVSGCPPNALFALDHEPAFVSSVLRPASALAVLALMLAATAVLHGRYVNATPLARRMFGPVLIIGAGRASLLGVAIMARSVDDRGWMVQAATWLLALGVPAVALAYLAGLLRWRLFAAGAMERLAVCLRAMPDGPTLRRAFADAFDDPTVTIAYPVGGANGRWADERGEPVELPAPGGPRAVTTVRDDGTVLAAIVHDNALRTYPALIESGTAMAALVLDNQRLAAEATSAMREVEQSRARIASTAVRERRRIERDLHDGAQQRLVALRIELELAEDIVRRDPERGADRLRELEQEVDLALEELRALAHGVYPPLLADRGLTHALRSAAMRSAIPVDFDARDVVRYTPEVESAVYFCVLESLQNVLKHARGARRVVVRLAGDPEQLRFSVRDDGPGPPGGVIRPGAGITNIRDRLAAVGGDVEISAATGTGTVVHGQVPVRRGAG